MNTRKESYEKIKPYISYGERKVIAAIKIGMTDAWSISNYTGMLITSVRRALHDLTKNNILELDGTIYHKGTNRNINKYKEIIPLTLFNNQND